MSGAASTRRSQLDLACFEVHGRTYAVDVMGIREIVRDAPVTPLPRAPEQIEGVVEVSGRTLPVFDLGRVLGGAPVEASEDSRIAVLERDGLLLGMRVDAAVDVLNVEAAALETPAAVGADAVVAAVLRREQAGPVLVLDLAALLDGVRGRARPAAAAAEGAGCAA